MPYSDSIAPFIKNNAAQSAEQQIMYVHSDAHTNSHPINIKLGIVCIKIFKIKIAYQTPYIKIQVKKYMYISTIYIVVAIVASN